MPSLALAKEVKKALPGDASEATLGRLEGKLVRTQA